MLQAFARYILQKKPDFMVYYYHKPLVKLPDMLAELEKYPYLTEEDIAIMQAYVDEKKVDGHGGFLETGALYDVCPELIDLEKYRAVDGTSCHRFDEFTKRGIYTPFGWMGNFPNSLGCSYHDGLNPRIAKAIAQKTTEQSAEIFKFLREETISDEYHEEWLAKQN